MKIFDDDRVVVFMFVLLIADLAYGIFKFGWVC